MSKRFHQPTKERVAEVDRIMPAFYGRKRRSLWPLYLFFVPLAFGPGVVKGCKQGTIPLLERSTETGGKAAFSQPPTPPVWVQPVSESFEVRTVWVTTYHSKYEGRRTKSGEVYRAAKHTVAVPRSLWKDLKGKRLAFGRFAGEPTTATLIFATVNDTVGPGVKNFDLSRGAWSALTDGAAPSRIRALVRIPKEG